jgi:CRP-like cAMP-binding protein
MEAGTLGREYLDGEVICRQGELGDCMYVVQAGRVIVARDGDKSEVVIAQLKAGDIFGEMAIFDRQPRSATVRADGQARVLTLDKRAFLRRVHEDPSLAFRILQQMSRRIRDLNQELTRLKQARAPEPSGGARA